MNIHQMKINKINFDNMNINKINIDEMNIDDKNRFQTKLFKRKNESWCAPIEGPKSTTACNDSQGMSLAVVVSLLTSSSFELSNDCKRHQKCC